MTTETYSILAVVGHIDHGKTTLTAALTGRNTDTLAEEKKRGITIELGFADFRIGSHRFGLIDAPGHQRYVGNLLSGVTSIDIGLLVVAADEGVQEQTREHARILAAFQVPRIIVAITKADRVDSETAELCAEEVRELLLETQLKADAVVTVSALGEPGIGPLTDALAQCAEAQPTEDSKRSFLRAHPWFRLPLDRSFVVEGRGRVVAGSVWSGTAGPDTALLIQPAGHPVRAREFQTHSGREASGTAGRRLAVNLAGEGAADAHRGCELVEEGGPVPADRLLVALRLFNDAPALRNQSTIRLYTATTAADASIRLLYVSRESEEPAPADELSIDPADAAFMQRIPTSDSSGPPSSPPEVPAALSPDRTALTLIRLSTPIIPAWSQRFLLRMPAPHNTVGFGRILLGLPKGRIRGSVLLRAAAGLSSDDPADRLTALVGIEGEADADDPHLPWKAGIRPNDFARVLQTASANGTVSRVRGSTRLMASEGRSQLASAMLQVLKDARRSVPPYWITESKLLAAVRKLGSSEAARQELPDLIESGAVVRVRQWLAAGPAESALSKAHAALLQRLEEQLTDVVDPPAVKELAAAHECDRNDLTAVLRFSEARGRMVEMSRDFWLSQAALNQLRNELANALRGKSEMTVAEIRDLWKVTRKHAVPFLEYFDAAGLTVRSDSLRRGTDKLLT